MPFNIPNTNTPSETINKILAKISTGKYFEIIKAITTEKSYLNFFDTSKRSVLHYILLNEELSNNEKYQLCETVIKFGAPLDVPDNEGIRPLHLACRQQNRKLVRLLLSKKADVNSIDNKKLSPLHYATNPNTEQCKKINKKLIKTVKEENEYIGSDYPIDELTDAIFDYVQNDEHILNHVGYIANIFKSKLIFTDDMTKSYITQIKSSINNIIKNKNPLDNLKNDLITLKKTITSDIKSNIKNSTSQIAIKSYDKTIETTGPIYNNEVMSILPFVPKKEFDKIKSKSLISFETSIEDFKNNLHKIIDRMMQVHKECSGIYDFYIALSILANHLNNDNEEDEDDNEEDDDEEDDNEEGQQDPRPRYQGRNYDPNYLPPARRANQPINQQDPRPRYQGRNYDPNYLPPARRANQPINQQEDNERDIDDNDRENFLNLIDFLNNHVDFIVGDIEIPQTMITNNNNFGEIPVETNDFLSLDDTKTIFTITSQYIRDMVKCIRKIRALITELTVNNVYRLYSVVGEIQKELLNICYINIFVDISCRNIGNKLKMLHNQFNILDIDNENLEDIIHNYNIGKNKDEQIDIDVTILPKFIKKFGIFDPLTSYNNDNLSFILYNSIIGTIKSLDAFVQRTNMVYGHQYIEKFHNSFVDNAFVTNITDSFDNNVITCLNKIELPPESFKDFVTIYSNIIYQTGQYDANNAIRAVTDILNKYSIMLSNTNTLFIATNNAPVEYVGNGQLQQIDGIFINRLNEYDNSSISHTVRSGRVKIYKGNDLTFDKLVDINQEHTIIRYDYDTNIYMIRLMTILYTTQQFVNIYTAGNINRGNLNNIEKILFDSMKTYHNYQKSTMKVNTINELIAIMAEIVDNIFINMFDNIVNLGASNYLQYLLTQQNYHFDNSLLSSNNLNNRKQLIVYPITKQTDNKQIISMIANNQNDIDNKGESIFNIINVFNQEENNETDIDFENTIYDTEKLDGQNICYKFNEDLIGDLLHAGANINAVGGGGETALSFALTIQNEQIIESLLRSGARVITKNINNYEKYFNQFLDSLVSSPIMNINETNDKLKSYIENKTGFNMVFQNSNLIMQMASYLFLHQIAIFTNTYPNMWSFDKQQTLLNRLNLTENESLPITKVNNNDYSVLNEMLGSMEIKLTKERDILIRIDNSINNLNVESRNTNDNRKNEINQLVNDLETNRNKVIDNIQNIINDINTLIAKKQNIQALQNNDNKKSTINKSTNVCDIYKQFFKKMVNTKTQDVNNRDYFSYINMWSTLFANNSNDSTQIVRKMFIDIIDNKVVEPNIFNESYDVYVEYYFKVLEKYGRDLNELLPYISTNGESYFEQNYALKQIFCIIEHVFSHIISINFINTVAQLLAKNEHNIEAIHQSMRTSGFIKFCINTMPKHIIKIVCNIHESENEKISSTVSEQLNKAIDLLSLNTYSSIHSGLIDKIKESIIPFFVDYIEAYTLEMYKMMISQCKLFINQAKNIRILKLMSSKTILEMSNQT